ncbi:hypothetical protein [Deinococcus aluminii]|uniref:Uncharacterized protein n=1 Tax=Deinococcus aluminii TaxID=1656885 RepID=A0ABP9XIY9_9DEIO
MIWLLAVLSVLCLLGLGGGFLFGFVQRRCSPRPGWALPLLLMLGAFLLPSLLLVSRVQEVLAGVADAPASLAGLALQFARLSVLLLVLALLLAGAAVLRQPFLAPLVPPALFVTFYGAVLPLAYRVERQVETVYLDNIPTVWLFVFCAVATASLLGYALGQQATPSR